MNNINNRIQRVVDELFEGNKRQFSKHINESPTNLNNILGERQSTPSSKIISSIVYNIKGLNAEWLLTGEGLMLKTENIQVNNTKGVPYYEGIEATGSILTSFNDVKENPSFYISYPHFDDCTAYLPMAGDSMYPKYCAGEIIAVKQIYNFDIIQWGEAYMIVTDSEANDLRTIKLLFPHKDEDKITLRASNPSFAGDTIIPKKNIVSLFLVKGKITRNQL